MKIQLKEWKVKDLALSSNQEAILQENDNNKFQLSFGHALSQDNSQEFVIGFKIRIVEDSFHIELEMIFVFETDSKLDEDFMNSSFLRINAPAIAFPYIRSYISNLTLQSGFNPIILPSINFVSLNEETK